MKKPLFASIAMFRPAKKINPAMRTTALLLLAIIVCLRAGAQLPTTGGTLTGNLKIEGTDENWAENLLLVKPSGWGGVRFARRLPSTGNLDGNWAVGYNANTGNDFSISNSYGGVQFDYLFHISAATRNVGIGTPTPQDRLTIGAGGRNAIRFNPGGYGEPGPFGTNSEGDKIILYHDGGYDARMGVGSTGNLWLKSIYPSVNGGGKIEFYTGNISKPNMVVNPDGNVGIGTTTPEFKSTVSQDITMTTDANVAQFGIMGSTDSRKRLVLGYDTNGEGFGFIKAAFYTQKWTNLSLQPNGGNVGIGTTSPSDKLEVGGNIKSVRFYNTSLPNSGNSRNSFQSLNTDESVLNTGWIAADFGGKGTEDRVVMGSGYGGKAILSANNGILTTWSDLCISPVGGNVGIGTTSPSDKLEVGGNIKSVRFYNTSLPNSGNSRNSFQSLNNNDPVLNTGWIAADFGGKGTEDRVVMGSGYGGKAILSANNGALTTWSDLCISPVGGNVGIGTTSPRARLEVNSGVGGTSGLRLTNLTSASATGAGQPIGVDASGNVVTLTTGTGTGTGTSQWLSSGVGISYSSGNVGIGTTTPISALNIGGDNLLTLGDYTASEGAKGISFTGYRDMATQYYGSPTFFGASIEAVPVWVCCGNDGDDGKKLKMIDLDFNIHTPGLWEPNAKTTAMRINSDANVGIGTIAPRSRLDIYGGVLSVTGTSRNGTVLVTSDGGTAYFSNNSLGNGLAVTSTGNVLIGKTSQLNASYKLDVAGNVRANKLTVNTTGADFVFEPSYKLMPLSEVEGFVNRNRHLPGIAPAAEMQQNGTEVGEQQTKLLQKLEELTLYIIQQDKRITELEAKTKK